MAREADRVVTQAMHEVRLIEKRLSESHLLSVSRWAFLWLIYIARFPICLRQTSVDVFLLVFPGKMSRKIPEKKSTTKSTAETKHQHPRVISGKGCPWDQWNSIVSVSSQSFCLQKTENRARMVSRVVPKILSLEKGFPSCFHHDAS